MGRIYKNIIHPFLSRCMKKKVFTTNLYLGLQLEAKTEDLMADELFRISLAYQGGLYMLPKDDEKARYYCLEAAKKGHAVAQLSAGMWMKDDKEAAMKWTRLAAKNGEAQALYIVSESCDDAAERLSLLRKSAEKGYELACTHLAEMYRNGDAGVVADSAIAKFWAFEGRAGSVEGGKLFKQLVSKDDFNGEKINASKIIKAAAEAGEPHAIFEHGNSFISTNENKAAEQWQKAVKAGSHYAMCNYGRFLSKRNDDEKAAELFRKAAEWGIEEGMFNLSKMYFEGVGVEKDSMKAWEWNEKALNLGFVPSRHLLAVMLMNGIGKDELKRGEFYLELAAEDGYGPAVKLKTEKEQERR